MSQIKEGDLLWRPSQDVVSDANLSHYMTWLAETQDQRFDTYRELWQWSVDDLPGFWGSLWDYFGIVASAQPSAVLGRRAMPGAQWFPGAELNYAQNFFARMNHDRPAMIYQAEDGPLIEVSWLEVQAKTAALARALKDLDVRPGDRVVAYLPHIPETIIALLAVASIGAIWSSCSPDFGGRSVLDRFQQIEPKVLLAVDGYTYNGKPFDRLPVVAELLTGLPSLEKTILVPLLADQPDLSHLADTILWDDLLAAAGVLTTIDFEQLNFEQLDFEQLDFEQVPFNHPLWVLYSSGTTGLPKPIVQGHGGILLEHLKMAVLHLDLKPEDRFFWYTSTGWMMWNFLVGGLLAGSTIVLYNGAPGYPDMNALWTFAERSGLTYFGTSAAFVSACIKAGIRPDEQFALSRVRAVGSTGSPLTVEGFGWIYDHVNRDLALDSVSGGTDLCTAFVGGCRLLPIYAGEIQGPALGAKVQALDETGWPVVDQVGELVISEPMPSMPLYFWNDPEDKRYLSSYFEMYPGIWRHGDWIKFTPRGGCVIYGRSDSTINRQGVRMGTSEIYRVVEAFPEVADSLVIDLESLGRESYLPLFVVLAEGASLNDDLVARIKAAIRADVSPRHVPDEILAVDEVPYTLSGKKMEVPIRRILLGQPAEQAANPGAMRNPEAIAYFVDLAAQLNPDS
ncbi:MAG TPA: acetoacetate--CoA ligase [Anaerolineae bacterium]|nr:acetoacetate--CoA ligase [Anaerolineae bacterium]